MRHTLVKAFVAFSLILAVLIAPVSAHPPSDLVLSYDPVTGELTATFTHMVQDPATHYVNSVEVDVVGGTRLLQRPYTSQPTNNTFTYTYPLQISNGTQITVSGECNLGGEIHRTLVIGQVPTTTATATPTETVTPTATATTPPVTTTMPPTTSIPPTTTQAPGFTFPVALLVLALVGGLLYHARR